MQKPPWREPKAALQERNYAVTQFADPCGGGVCPDGGPDRQSFALLKDAHPHGLYAIQLFGCEPEALEKAILLVREKGIRFDILDINMGCPAPKITNSGAGSKLLLDPPLCGRMVAAARRALGEDTPLTVKMRIGWDAEHLTGVEVAKQCEANGADLMIGRGALGDPWLFEQIHAALLGEEAPAEPTLNQRMNALRAQIYEMCEEKGEWLAMPQARSQAMHYMKGLRGAASLRRYCSMLEHFTDVDKLIDAVYRLQE